ncbi:MAG: hypothetical protein L0Y71_06890 [Gemmataceae bacterium]|nr:hypothetical protein [Gemmataceae bacterium]
MSEAASAIVEAIKTGSPFPQPDGERIVAAVGEEVPASEIVRVVQALQPLLRGCDWPRYLSQEGLPLDGLTWDEREALESQQPEAGKGGSDPENDPVAQEWQRREAEHEKWEAAESPLVQRLESLLGADGATVKEVAEAIGSVSDAFLTLPKWPGEQLPGRLRASLPASVPSTAASHQCSKFVHSVLRAIGSKGRQLPQVIRLCGRELGLLFPDEIDPRAGTYKFRQARYLLEDRLASSPHDVEAVAWLAELNLRAGDVDAAAALARRLWLLSEGCEPSDVARLVQFSLAHDWDYSEPSFDGTDSAAGLLGRLEGEWFDREEPLAHAMLRRAFAGDRWNADLVQTVVELRVGWSGEDLADDIMPASGWVWAAHSFGQAGQSYYRAWEKALAAATTRGEREIVVLAVPFLIAGALRRRCIPNYGEWLDALSRHATTPSLRRAVAKVLAGLKNVVEGLLPAPARVTLVNLKREFAVEMASTPTEDSDEVIVVLKFLDVVDQQVPAARNSIGDGTWDRLSENTRHNVCEALGLYHAYQHVPGDRRNYGTAIVALSNAILSEVDLQLSLALLKRRSGYFRQMGCQKSLGELWHLLDGLQREVDASARKDAQALRARGIQVNKIARVMPELWKLKGVRNPAAHAEKIDREKAALVFSAWFGKGLLREFFEAILPTT